MAFAKALSVCLSLCAVALASPTCYFPDGSVAGGYTSCSSGDEPAHCCSKESICLSNGYCLSASLGLYTLARPTCTEKDWPSNICNNPCSEIPSTDSTGCTLVLYRNIDDEVLYCPNSIVANSSTSTGCANGAKPFSISPSTEIVTNRAALANASCAADSTSPSASATASTSTRPLPTDCSSDSNNSSDDGNNKNVAIGAGVGVPLGALALAALGWALVERKRRYKLINTPRTVIMPPSDKKTPMPPQGIYADQEKYPVQEIGTGRSRTAELEGSRL